MMTVCTSNLAPINVNLLADSHQQRSDADGEPDSRAFAPARRWNIAEYGEGTFFRSPSAVGTGSSRGQV